MILKAWIISGILSYALAVYDGQDSFQKGMYGMWERLLIVAYGPFFGLLLLITAIQEREK